MRRLSPFLVLIALLVNGAAEAAKPKVTILFLGADIRERVKSAERPRATLMRRRFRIRIDAVGVRAPRARLLAALVSADGGRRVSIDGIALSTTPQLITASAHLGEPEGHTLEIETLSHAAKISEETLLWTAEVR